MLLPLFDKNPSSRFAWVVLLLILGNIFCFVQLAVQPEDPLAYVDTVYEHGFIPQRLSRMDEAGPITVELEAPDPNRQGAVARFERTLSTDPWAVYSTMVTMMFLHGGLLHLASNLWMLWVFGDNVEDRLGWFVFLFFYLAGGLVAVLTQWAVDPLSTRPVIGASGAVAAVLGGYMVTYPLAKVKTLFFIGIPLLLDLPAYLVLGAWFLMQTFAGVQGWFNPQNADISVAFWAHIGGFLAGAILMPLLTLGAEPRDEDWRSESSEFFGPAADSQ